MSFLKNFILFIFILSVKSLFGQELNCDVSVLTPQIMESNKQIYDVMQSQIREFMNNRKWTNDQFSNQERIECGIIINITARPATTNFSATIQIQARRPVYRSSYNSILINHMDNDFTFSYVQDQVLEFDENTIRSNLVATLAYYAYIIIGFDYDTYSPEGGNPYFNKAQTIVNNCQQLPDKGWKSFESGKNRYWLVENALNVGFKPMRESIYKYHRLGFDRMTSNMTEARAQVLSALKDLRPVYNDKPNSFFMQFFFNAKSDEIVNLFSQADPDEKKEAMELLTVIDPGNISKYNTIEK